MSFVFSRILNIGSQNDVPYPLFLFRRAGAVGCSSQQRYPPARTPWVGASSLVTKVYFPRELLPTAAVLTKLVDLFFGFVILAMLMALLRSPARVDGVLVPAALLHPYDLRAGPDVPAGCAQPLLPRRALSRWRRAHALVLPDAGALPAGQSDPGQVPLDISISTPNAVFIDRLPRVILYGDNPDFKRVLLGAIIAIGTFLIGYYIFKRMEAGFCGQHLTARRSSSGTSPRASCSETVGRCANSATSILRGADWAHQFFALKDVSFSVHHGETLGIIGPQRQAARALR